MAIVKIRYKMLNEVTYHGDTNTRYDGYWLMEKCCESVFECLVNTEYLLQLHRFKPDSGDYNSKGETGWVLRLFNNNEIKLVKEYVASLDGENEAWRTLESYTDLFIKALDYTKIQKGN